MAKAGEKTYFKKIGKEGLNFTVHKPHSDRINVGCLMHNVAAIASLIKNLHDEKTVRVLDVGCGSGWTSNQFALIGHEVVGVDISKDAIDAARKNFTSPRLTFECVDYDNIGTKLGLFDVVVFHDSLHHSEDPSATLSSIKKTMKNGSTCIVCEPGKGHSKSPDAIEAVEKYGVTEADMPPRKIVECARVAGFTKHKTYASPSAMHRALYWEYGGKLSLLRFDVFRLSATLMLFILKKYKEGIVVLYNESN